MEAAKIAREEINKTGNGGSEQTKLKEGVSVDGETGEPEKNTINSKMNTICKSPRKYYRQLTNQKERRGETVQHRHHSSSEMVLCIGPRGSMTKKRCPLIIVPDAEILASLK